jgi:prepilin-type N-terminal cleavage/methylation domain-containing protein
METRQKAECRMRNELKGSGFGVQGSGISGQWAVGGEQCILSSSFIPHPSSFKSHPSRRGLSLMEVLISIFVLSIGLLGVAALIPLGQMALWETAKADRSGACGRAALREIQVGRMLDFRYWFWRSGQWGPYLSTDTYSNVAASTNTESLPFVVDPLGRAKGLPDTFGLTTSGVCMSRRTLQTAPLSPSTILPPPPMPDNSPMADTLAAQIFFWNDDLAFDIPKNSNIRPTLITSGGNIVSEGGYSWFFTVMPAATEMAQPVASRRLFNVSAAVCYKRNFQLSDSTQPVSATVTHTFEGEHTATITAATGFPGMGIGGGTVQLNNQVNAKENQWVMLYHLDSSTPPTPQLNRCCWYRVVGVNKDMNMLSLNGPDWDPNLDAVLVVVPGVIGVYNTTMELDWDPLWTK